MLPSQRTEKLGPSKLKSTLDHRLISYAAVASAAGVTALALAQTAAAEIVYTPADISVGNSYALDLNHDGIPDFTFQVSPVDSGHGHDLSLLLDVPGNAALIGPLPIGAPIGGGRKFDTSVGSYGGIPIDENFEYGTIHSSGGPWFNVSNKFMGFKFMLGGEVHYGWARLTVTGATTATITGYAYETTPNYRIRAGQRSESEEGAAAASGESVKSRPSALGILAAGVSGLAPRREN
jgi:hypothetical protein